MNSLIVENISFNYDLENPILKDVSFILDSGETLGILGPNGGGKSTLMKILSGLIKPSHGKITYDGIPCSNIGHFPYHLLAYVPQNSELNTILPLKVSEYIDYSRTLYSQSQTNESTDDLLNKVGVFHKKDFLLSRLSGGEKQRVLIARALINHPKYLLLDEPTKGLDSNGVDQLLDLISDIKKQYLTAVVIVDHNINHIIKNCDKILCLNKTHHWHDRSDVITKNILQDIYHCEFEHLLIHQKESNVDNSDSHQHHFCNHDHGDSPASHSFIKRKK